VLSYGEHRGSAICGVQHGTEKLTFKDTTQDTEDWSPEIHNAAINRRIEQIKRRVPFVATLHGPVTTAKAEDTLTVREYAVVSLQVNPGNTERELIIGVHETKNIAVDIVSGSFYAATLTLSYKGNPQPAEAQPPAASDSRAWGKLGEKLRGEWDDEYALMQPPAVPTPKLTKAQRDALERINREKVDPVYARPEQRNIFSELVHLGLIERRDHDYYLYLTDLGKRALAEGGHAK